jgi:hypothetical protein
MANCLHHCGILMSLNHRIRRGGMLAVENVYVGSANADPLDA